MKSLQKGFVAPLLLVIIVVLVVGGGVYLYKNKKPGAPALSTEIKQTTITSIDADWKQLKNDKYHYQINFPTTNEQVIGNLADIVIRYKDTSTGNGHYIARMNISLLGILNEPIEETASRISPSGLFEETVLNGSKAIKINHKHTYGDPPVSFGEILVRNKQNLNLLIRIDTNVGSKYKELLEKSMQTFQFIDQQSLVAAQELTLFGKVSVRSGNCMPGPGSGHGCGREPISATVLIYPLQPKNNSLAGEKNASLLTKTKSDKDGNYRLTLPPGTYSMYVDDNGEEICAGGGGRAGACSITLYESDEESDIVIDHAVW